MTSLKCLITTELITNNQRLHGDKMLTVVNVINVTIFFQLTLLSDSAIFF